MSATTRNGFPEITPVQSQRASDEIAQRIRLLVASKQLKAGDRLPAERELSSAFNVGRNTLREALRSLEIAGLIEMKKGGSGGAFITAGGSGAVVSSLLDLYHLGTITPTQLTEARMWIETIVVEVAAPRMTDDDIAALEANLEETQRAEDSGDFAARAAVGLEFHSLLGKATRNPILSIAMDALIELTRQFVTTLGPKPNRFALPSKRRFIAALKAGKIAVAKAEMADYLDKVQTLYLARLEQAGETARTKAKRG